VKQKGTDRASLPRSTAELPLKGKRPTGLNSRRDSGHIQADMNDGGKSWHEAKKEICGMKNKSGNFSSTNM
jgi:hypothetical protein